MVYSFANCVMGGAPFLDMFQPVERSIVNMKTEGILRLLDGETIIMHDDDRQRLYASRAWAEYSGKYFPHVPPDSPLFSMFHPFSPQADDVFLWSPFADCVVSFTSARCTDGTLFPCIREPMGAVFEHHIRMPFVATQALWHALAHKLAHVRKKAVILYPPDTMHETIRDPDRRAYHVDRVRFSNEQAASLFSSYGWRIFSPEAQLEQGQSDWSHYSDQSRRMLWNDIALAFDLPYATAAV
ncbi:MAG TPA: hypothetical protein VHA78_06040 [Candidatus Peribacteraceae bacterium]|nr:hypothetical protein [Candidatus Peribacteraceae bacterium]